MLRTNDNNCGNFKADACHLPALEKIANTQISNLSLENTPNLLVFPHSFDACEDKVGSQSIFSLEGCQLTTGNVMGFVGVDDSEITIHSRFATEEKDYFLHYMLHKVFAPNLFELKHSSDSESIFDFLIYLFPYFLKDALSQGLYKEYQSREYNDANVRGCVDVTRHIRKNMPFNGKVAYRVREHCYDNKITQLIRHAIDFIQKHHSAAAVLRCDAETLNGVGQIIQSTPTFDRNQRRMVMNRNLRPLAHPYFSKYRFLQRICLQILRYEGLKFGSKEDKVYGLLFDGAWLWEEYLNTILKECGFNHPQNKCNKGGVYLFQNPRSCLRFPDFWKKNVVIDAKYKRLANSVPVDRNDMHQIVTYMYILQAHKGAFLVPVEGGGAMECRDLGELNGYGGNVKIWGFPIPQTAGSFDDFWHQMQVHENELKNEMKFGD